MEIDGEPFNQQQAEEKGGERHGGKHRDAHQMIKPGARAQGRNHAHRQADAPVKDQRDAVPAEKEFQMYWLSNWLTGI